MVSCFSSQIWNYFHNIYMYIDCKNNSPILLIFASKWNNTCFSFTEKVLVFSTCYYRERYQQICVLLTAMKAADHSVKVRNLCKKLILQSCTYIVMIITRIYMNTTFVSITIFYIHIFVIRFYLIEYKIIIINLFLKPWFTRNIFDIFNLSLWSCFIGYYPKKAINFNFRSIDLEDNWKSW